MSGTTTAITPVTKIGRTILGLERQLYANTGLTPVYDTSASLNAKYSVAQTLVPTSFPPIAYFGIGIGGCFNVDSSNLTEAYPVQSTNMDLYTPIPFQCVPVEQDLSATVRANYRMRRRMTINGNDYFLYYLKLITYNQSTVQLTETDPVTKLQSPYVLDYADLNPTHPTTGSGGTITSSATEINAGVTCTLPLTGAEVTSVINILYNGDMRRAKISEIGLYSGQDRVISGLNASGGTVSYTEAVLAQLNMACNTLGDDWSNPARTSSYQIIQGSGDLILM